MRGGKYNLVSCLVPFPGSAAGAAALNISLNLKCAYSHTLKSKKEHGYCCFDYSDCNASVEARIRKNAPSMRIIAWFQRNTTRGRISFNSCRPRRAMAIFWKYAHRARAAIIEGGKGWCQLIRNIGNCTVVMHHAWYMGVMSCSGKNWVGACCSIMLNPASAAACVLQVLASWSGLPSKAPSILPALHHWFRSLCL